MNYQEILEKLPPALQIADARTKIRDLNASSEVKIVVLDDDPTGCQTVHAIKILMNWEKALLEKTCNENDCFYILTNSRAYPEKEAIRLNHEIAQRLLDYVDSTALRVISRSDSTLRGHFLGEVTLLMQNLGPFDGVLIVPYFKEGGRLTAFDTHYVLQNDKLLEAHKTEFARDTVFGYQDAYLPTWVEERSNGRWKKEQVVSVSIEDIRTGGPERVLKLLQRIENATPVVINALCDEDLEVVVLGLCQAEMRGKRFLYRTAASFVKMRAAIPDKALYLPERSGRKGLIIIGSYVERTTNQLNYLLEKLHLERVEIKIAPIFSDTWDSYLQSQVRKVDDSLRSDKSVVIYTQRDYVSLGNQEQQLASGKKISDFLSAIITKLTQRPDFIIAKGGITAHDIAKVGLRVEEALVLGQVAPGVPIWRLGKESKYPGLLYVVFPGNVGDEKTLGQTFNEFLEDRTSMV